MREITGFQRDLLYVISGLDDPKGMQIQEELENYYGTNVLHARVYQNLDELVEADLVEKGQQDSRTNYYRLTEAGEEAIEERREWESQYVEPMLKDAN